MIRQFAEKLGDSLKHLPGHTVQERMAPPHRLPSKEWEKYYERARLGGVLILFYPDQETIRTVMIQRPEYVGVHSGQVAFPGGQMERSDRDLIDTALREAHEEVGVDLSSIHVLGSLTRLYIPPSNFLITPVVAYSANHPMFKPDKNEVAALIEPSVEELLDEKAAGIKPIRVMQEFSIQAPCYTICNRTVWGATAMIIAELNEILKRVLPR
ncbi:MAG: coenzyme A pyrophosphatase [Chitinophagales bacterium]|nr:MAG: coenzyme A pyrophosphatase [Chitinophagales bacterium]